MVLPTFDVTPSASLDSMIGTLRYDYTAQHLEPVYKVLVHCVCLKFVCIFLIDTFCKSQINCISNKHIYD